MRKLVLMIALAAVLPWACLPTCELRGPRRVRSAHAVCAGSSLAYVVLSGNTALLVDAGSDPQAAALLTALGSLGLRPKDVAAVLVTSAQRDHVAGLDAFPDAEVFVAAKDHLLARGDQLPPGLWPRLNARLHRRQKVHPRLREVVPGERLAIAGLSIDTVPVPGVTPGATAYLVGDVLFVGDALWGNDQGIGAPPWFMGVSNAATKRAAHRLLQQDARVLALSHHGFVSGATAQLVPLASK